MKLKLRDDELIKSLARTEEFIGVKREMNQARQQVSVTSHHGSCAAANCCI